MAKIGNQQTIERGIALLADVFKEIDEQIGDELGSKNAAVDGQEVSTFLINRGDKVPTTTAAVSRTKAYLRRRFKADEVDFEKIGSALQQAKKSIMKAAQEGKPVEELKPTWRAIALFAAEAHQAGLGAKEIVADRNDAPIMDIDVVRKGIRLTSGVLSEIEKSIGDGDGTLTSQDIEAFIAGYQNTVPTAKEAVRRFARYLKKRYGKEEFTRDEVNEALGVATRSIYDAAKKPGGRSKLAWTWKPLVAFAEEASIRGKDAKQIAADVKQPEVEDGPRAGTLAAWDALDLETRFDILDDYGPKYDHYVTSGEVSLSDLEGPRRAFAQKMVDSLLDHVGECEDGHYGLVGDPNTTIEVVELPTGEIVGGRVHLFQQGFDPEEEDVEIDEDEISYHYDSAEACAAAGFDPDQDISWGVSGLFNHDAQPLDEDRMDTYWEWSGW